MSKKSIVKFDDLDIEVLSSEQELVELAGGKGKSLLQEALEFLGADLNAGNCNCNNCNCSNCLKVFLQGTLIVKNASGKHCFPDAKIEIT